MCIVLWIVAVVALTTSNFAVGADFSGGPGPIVISGPIERGDYTRFTKYLLRDARHIYMLRSGVILNSPGGDVDEALKLASLFDKSFITTFVRKGDVCASACFLLWAGGAVRHNLGLLGVHRLSLDSNSTDIRRTAEKTKPASQVVETFLVNVGIPRKIIDKMQETSPSTIFMMDINWMANAEIDATYNPVFLDVAEKACGPDPTYQAVRRRIRLTFEEARMFDECIADVQTQNQRLHQEEILSVLLLH